jgi:hypothetical protein
MNETERTQNKVISQMTQIILSDILEQVIKEFETTTGTQIGGIHVGPANSATQRRPIQISIKKVSEDSLTGLMRYKKILCDHEMFAEDDICTTSN